MLRRGECDVVSWFWDVSRLGVLLASFFGCGRGGGFLFRPLDVVPGRGGEVYDAACTGSQTQ